MKKYEIGNTRVFGVVGHGDSGKTSLVSTLLFNAGMTTRLCSVMEGNTVTDFDENEIERKISISLTPCYAEYDKVRYQGREYFIKGRMSTGYAVLMDIHGCKQDCGHTPRMEQMKRLSARTTCLLAYEKIITGQGLSFRIKDGSIADSSIP